MCSKNILDIQFNLYYSQRVFKNTILSARNLNNFKKCVHFLCVFVATTTDIKNVGGWTGIHKPNNFVFSAMKLK